MITFLDISNRIYRISEKYKSVLICYIKYGYPYTTSDFLYPNLIEMNHLKNWIDEDNDRKGYEIENDINADNYLDVVRLISGVLGSIT